MAATVLRIAIVGDVHDEWDPVKDAKSLRHLKPDVVLLTGDFGDENVDLVRDVSQLDFPKAAILGNHDCWRIASPFAAYIFDKTEKDGVQEYSMLGNAHVGYSRLDFAELGLSVVGGRPFSKSSGRILRVYNPFGKLLAPRYGVHNFQESAERIAANAKKAPQDNVLVFLAHNGPRGLGSMGQDICGRDWSEHGGDQGDPDLEEAIAAVKLQGLRVPLVVFGHMHQGLFGEPQRLPCTHLLERTMLVEGPDKTIYLNAAVVPRVRVASPTSLTTQWHFVLVELHNREVERVFMKSGSLLGKWKTHVKLSKH